MHNLWTTSGEFLAGWIADLGAPEDPARLRTWMQRVLEAGERQEVYRVRVAPLAGYPAGDPAAGVTFDRWLQRRWEVDGVLDVGHFGTSGVLEVEGRTLRAAATVSWLDATGAPVDGVVEDLGELLRDLTPPDVAAAGPRVVSCPPLDVRGPLVDARHPERSRWELLKDRVLVMLSVRSDIWSPWVPGLTGEPAPVGWRDNRVLARRHTPRLNAFLAAAREATSAAGGRWEVDAEALFAKLGLVSEAGFDLDAPNPVP